MIDFDPSRRLLRPGDWLDLLQAVLNADPKDEFDWIEWKSTVDWSDRHAYGANVARHILGLANRTIPTEPIGGKGLLIVGLEPGQVTGVQPIDTSVLDDKLRAFLGGDGPGWIPQWWRIEGRDVLTIEVPEPTTGQPQFALRTALPKYAIGTVFVRLKAKTVVADQAQLNAMALRFGAQPETEILIDVWADVEQPLFRYHWTEEGIETFLASRRQVLHASMEADKASKISSNGVIRAAPLRMFAFQEDQRSYADYEAEVERYLHDLRDRLPGILFEVGASAIPAPQFRVSNQTALNFKELRITYYIAGEVDAIDASDDRSLLVNRLPSPPLEYGTNSTMASIIRMSQVPMNLPPVPYLRSRHSRRTFTNGGSVRGEFDELDLRPHEKATLLEDELVLLVPKGRAEKMTVAWSATASNVDAIATGEFEIPLSTHSMDLLELSQMPEV